MIDANLPRLREFLAREEKITIVVRKNPDLDIMASATALYLTFTKAGKQSTIACPTAPIVELSSLVGIDKVVTSWPVSGGQDLTMVLPYEKGKIEKISYNIEGDKIHLVVKAGPDGLGFETQDIRFTKSGGSTGGGLIFLVGVETPQDLDSLYSEDLAKGSSIVILGNKTSSGFGEGVILIEDQQAASVSELTVGVLKNLEAPLDFDIAQNLMQGIVFATNNFQGQASPLSFEMAGILLRYGATRETGSKPTQTQPLQAWELGQETKQEKKEQDKKENLQNPPEDWLTPKIYKGSMLP